MRYIRYNNIQGSRSTNPFVQVIGLVIGVAFFIGAVLLGGIVLAALMGFLLIAGLIIYIRIWWLMRKARRQQQEESFVEAEYRVIDTHDDEQR